VNTTADGMQLHGEHVHDADPDGHDHSADVDVSIFELGTLWAKLLFVLPVLGFALAISATGCWRSRRPSVTTPVQRWRSRWRPPLRAPPLPA
jgi:hypothetical protein